MKGTYVLVMFLASEDVMRIGKLGSKKFEKGVYAYVGSALNSLEGRINRHLKDDKKLHWHIDYFLSEAEIISIIYGESNQKKECEIAEYLGEEFSIIENFGSSDCDCRSHFFYGGQEDFEAKIIKSFKKAGLEPERWS
ncbi:MAG: GIY-YIG nuclease family protein [Hadesarchaea archaeon]|nr:GIY-YIG nuclease family protein [Hadesarchaea archaeon]